MYVLELEGVLVEVNVRLNVLVEVVGKRTPVPKSRVLTMPSDGFLAGLNGPGHCLSALSLFKRCGLSVSTASGILSFFLQRTRQRISESRKSGRIFFFEYRGVAPLRQSPIDSAH